MRFFLNNILFKIIMVGYILGDIGNYTDPLLYLYDKDLEHPSENLCECGRHLHMGNSKFKSITFELRPQRC